MLGVEELRALQDAVREIYVDSTVSRLHRPRRRGHAEPSGRLPGRVAARLDRALPGRPGAGRPARPRLRDPGRHQGARRARPGPSPDHQDQLVDPRRPVRAGRARAARGDLDRRHPPDRRRSDGDCARPRPDRPRRAAEPTRHRLRDATRGCPDDAPTAGDRHRHDPGRRGVLDRLAVPLLPALPVPARRRRLVRPGPPGPVRPRGRLRGQPAQRPRRRPDAGHLHAAQQQPGPEALARGPQPDDAARRAARPGDVARRPERAVVAHPGAADPTRPLPDRAAAHPDRRPVRLLRGGRDGRPGRQRHRLPAPRAAADVAPAEREPRGQPRRPASARSRRRPWRRPSGRTRRATA